MTILVRANEYSVDGMRLAPPSLNANALCSEITEKVESSGPLPVTIQELLISILRKNAIADLVVEKGIVTQEEILRKYLANNRCVNA